MEREHSSPAEGSAKLGQHGSFWWILGLVGLLAWQGWMTLTLFGRASPWQQLVDDQPILDGRHPLHFYHGILGARAFWTSGGLCAYDPSFQVGYPKTPVFDGGSRPAELFLALTGGDNHPAAYKIGLACCCLLVPCFLVVACRGAGLSYAATFFATLAGQVVWWSVSGQAALQAGDLDLLLAALALVAHVGLLVRYDREPGMVSWLGLLVTGSLACFAHLLLFCLLLPIWLIYYLTSGARHRELTWHVGLLASVVGAVGINTFWLIDWIHFWWLRAPSMQATPVLAHRTFRTLWESSLWGSTADRDVSVFLMASALVGTIVLNQMRQRVAARVLGLGTVGLCVLAILGIAWEPLGRAGTDILLVPGLLFAVLPAAYAWTQVYHLVEMRAGRPWLAALSCLGIVLAGAMAAHRTVVHVAQRCTGPAPLTIGLGPDRQALVATLLQHTRPDARILWEERHATRTTSRWTALLPLLAERSFIGGLDSEAGIEHLHVGLVEQKLAGQPIRTMSDAALDDYCRHYNVGWIVCWSPDVIARLRAWKDGAYEIARVIDGEQGVLFALRRPTRSYVLRGQARLVHADSQRITLSDVVPDKDGKVVLSFHYQTGLRVSPSRVKIEREPDPTKSIPLIRLHLTGPVARLTLTWDDR